MVFPIYPQLRLLDIPIEQQENDTPLEDVLSCAEQSFQELGYLVRGQLDRYANLDTDRFSAEARL